MKNFFMKIIIKLVRQHQKFFIYRISSIKRRASNIRRPLISAAPLTLDQNKRCPLIRAEPQNAVLIRNPTIT